jgi:O-antigen ligase
MVANLAFLFFLILPFHISLGTVGSSDILSIRLLIPLLIFLWASFVFIKRKIFLPTPLTLFTLSTFLVWMLLSLTWAENGSWAIRKIVFWLSFFPFFLVLISLFQDKEVRTQAIRGLLWGGALISLVGIFQFLAQFFIPVPVLAQIIFQHLSLFLGINFGAAVTQYPSIFVNIGGHTVLRAFGFFPDPHIFAYYTGMLLPLASYWALQKRSTVLEKTFPFCLVIATLLSFSRASYVALIGTFLLAGCLYFFHYKKKFSVPLLFTTIGVIVLLFLSPIATRFQSSFSSSDGSVTERTRLWQEAIENMKDHPFTGVGLGNYPLQVKPSAEPREPIYVHNLYLDMIVEIGIVGLSLFLLFLFSCLPKFCFRGEKFLSYQLALFFSLSIFLLHSFFEYPLFSVHILTLLLTLLAFLYVEKKS